MGSVIYTMGTASRSVPFTALDRSPAFNRIRDAYDNAKAKVDERIAKRYLKHFRRLVAKHNTKNHAGKITISAAMGACSVDIDGVSIEHDSRWNGWNQRKGCTPLMRLLFDIDSALNWDWAYALDGEALN